MKTGFLEQCEREKLHLSGAIQPHGALLVANLAGRITHASENTGDLLGEPPSGWIGRALPESLGTLAESLSKTAGSRRWSIVQGFAGAGHGPLQALLTRGNNLGVIAEIVPVPEEPPPTSELTPETYAFDNGLHPGALAERQEAIVRAVSELTGFSRVMYYSFRDDGDGEVIAEHRQGEAYGSYLGLRYPASDIPEVARRLYLANPWRLIPHAAATRVGIVGATPEPPDLTYADLRSVSPVHQVYLANMRVVASLSFPIIDSGTLVGLVAAHHPEPRLPSFAVLEQCAALVSRHAEVAKYYRVEQALRHHDALQHRAATLRPFVESIESLCQQWNAVASQLLEGFAADGVRLYHGHTVLQHGSAGAPSSRAALDAWFDRAPGETFKMTDNLQHATGRIVDPDIAGVLALSATCRVGPVRLFMTRREHIHEVAWGGRPDKPIETADGELQIAPRQSFEKWVEKRFGFCRPWTQEQQHLALKVRLLLLQGLRR